GITDEKSTARSARGERLEPGAAGRVCRRFPARHHRDREREIRSRLASGVQARARLWENSGRSFYLGELRRGQGRKKITGTLGNECPIAMLSDPGSRH